MTYVGGNPWTQTATVSLPADTSRQPSLVLGWPVTESNTSSANTTTESVLSQKATRSLSRSIQYFEDRHLITFAPTGSGKGVGVIIPNLLHYRGPAIVIDPKGENFAVTARYRRDVLRQTIFLLDPFHAVPHGILTHLEIERQCLNPRTYVISKTTSADMDAQMLADLLAGDELSLDNPF